MRFSVGLPAFVVAREMAQEAQKAQRHCEPLVALAAQGADSALGSLFLLLPLVVVPLDGEEHARAEHDELEHDEDDRDPVHYFEYFQAVDGDM